MHGAAHNRMLSRQVALSDVSEPCLGKLYVQYPDDVGSELVGQGVEVILRNREPHEACTQIDVFW